MSRPAPLLARASGSITTAAYVAGWRGVRRLPEPAARTLFDVAAARAYRHDGRGVRQLRRNLAHAVDGADEELVRSAVRSYFRYWCESFRLPSWPLEDLVARTRTVDEHRLREPLEAGTGVVAALPHMANWDWAGAWACATGAPLMTVAERLRPERLYDEFVAFRASLGMRILPLTGGPPSFPRLVDWVRAGGFACLLADRDLSRTAVEVTMCGRRARLPRGPAVLARQTGAPLVPITLAYRRGAGARVEMEIDFRDSFHPGPGEGGVVAAMQRVADAFTAAISQDPEDWHMMQRVFSEVAEVGAG